MTAKPIIAACDTCNVTFIAGGVTEDRIAVGQGGQSVHIGRVVAGPSGIDITGSRVGPCPNCGGWGRIPDGIYSFLRRAVTAARESHLTPQQAGDLADALRKAAGSPPDEAEAATARAEEIAPALRPIIEEAGKSKVHLKLLAFVVTVLLGLGAIRATDNAADQAHQDSMTTEHQLDIIIEELRRQLATTGPTPTAPPPPVAQPPATLSSRPPKLGRNGPCPCGGAHKAKYHDQLTPTTTPPGSSDEITTTTADPLCPPPEDVPKFVDPVPG